MGLVLFLFFPTEKYPQKKEPSHHWHSNVEIARKVMSTFESFRSYSANFQIRVREGKRSRNMKGKIYYQKQGKLRYEFTQPQGNLIVSNGRIMWFYIKRLNVAGKQDLTLQTKTSSGRKVFQNNPITGVKRLFQKYHYRFDSQEQPRKEGDRLCFVFDLEQREKIGGYEHLTLYVDAKTYLIYKAIGDDGYGKTAEMNFSDISLNPELEGSLFQYNPSKGVSVVSNPLVGKGRKPEQRSKK